VILLVGAVAAPGYQIHMGESVSFHKHLALGLILGAPAAGALLDRLWRVRFGAAAVVAVLWLAFMQGVTWSDRLWAAWPDTRPLASVLEYSVDAMPWIRMVGDNPEPLQYQLRSSTQPWQFTATYEGSFFYEDLSGLAAYEKALQDNYFQLAFFDGSNGTSAALMPRMAEFGFTRTGTVEDPRTGHEWQIWQRFDAIP
jgi:MFS family permease